MNDKIKKIEEYFVGMNVASGYIYITVHFPEQWRINTSIEDKYNVKAVKTEDEKGYYFFSSMDNGFDNIFSAIEDTINFNIMALLKQELFVKKIKELQTIFEDEPMEVLNTLEFKYKKKKSRKIHDDSNETLEEKEVEECQTV